MTRAIPLVNDGIVPSKKPLELAPVSKMKYVDWICGAVRCAFFVACLIPAHAQHREIDSLEHVLSKTGRKDTVRILLLNQLGTLYSKIDATKSFAYAQTAQELSVAAAFKKGEFEALLNMTSYYERDGNFPKALENLKNASNLSEKIGDSKMRTNVKLRLGNIYLFMGYDSKALEEYNAVKVAAETSGDKEMLAKSYNGLGNVYNSTGNYSLARQYYNAALKIYLESRTFKKTGTIYANLAELSYKEKHYEESIRFYYETLTIAERHDLPHLVGYSLQNIAQVYYVMNNYTLAENTFAKALKYYREEYLSPVNEAYCLDGLGRAHEEKHALKKALHYHEQSLAITKNLHDYVGMARAYKSLSRVNHLLNKDAQAFAFQSLLLTARDTLSSRSEHDKIHELTVRYQVEDTERQLVESKREEESKSLIIVLISSILVLGASVALLVISRQRLLRKQEKIASANLRITMESKLQRKEIEQENMLKEVASKNKELVSFTLNMIRKNECLEEVKRSLLEVKQHLHEPEVAHNKLHKIQNNINFLQHLDKDWENFKFYFEQTDQGFLDTLKVQFPDLNPNESKLCALLRLNLDTKQIASILDISVESTKVARSRLRKKLNLSVEQNLTAFLSNFNKASAKAMPQLMD
jgi:tetratricopeptide (TPR) repeat protein